MRRSHERPRLLFAGELRAIAALFALALLLLAALAVSHLGAFLMKRLVTFTAIAAAAVALSGCAGLTAFNSALVPELKPVDARIHTDQTCGALARQVMGVTADHPLSADQAVAIVQYCEARDASTTLTLDPQGARKVLQGVLNKPAGAAAAILPVSP